MIEIHQSGLARLKLRWPEQRPTLDARWSSDTQFREMCEAYELAFRGRDHWLGARDPVARDRVDEYQALIDDTERDIFDMIGSANRVAAKPHGTI